MNSLAIDTYPVTTIDIIDARNTLQDDRSTDDERLNACAILAQSPDCEDRIAARETRNAIWSTPASELDAEARRIRADLRQIDALDAVCFHSPWSDANESAVRREGVEDAVKAFGRLVMFAVIAASLAMVAVMVVEGREWVADGMPQPGAPMIYLEDVE